MTDARRDTMILGAFRLLRVRLGLIRVTMTDIGIIVMVSAPQKIAIVVSGGFNEVRSSCWLG